MRYLFYIAFVAVAASCNQQIPFDDPQTEPKLVVHSFIEPNDPVSVSVSRSSSILRPRDVEVLNDVAASFYENGTHVGDFTVDESDIYNLDFYPTLGNVYEVRVEDDELESISSETTIPSPASVSNVTVEDVELLDDDSVFRIAFDLDDPDGENFYILHVVQQFSVGSQSGVSFVSTEPYFLGGSQDNYFWSGAAFRDDSFNGQKKRMVIDVDWFNPGEDITYQILLVTASEEHFLYHLSYRAYQETNGDPFAQPVQIFSNVENGLGIFAGHNKTFTEIPN
jgi:hypothetical protein